jgi:hypothetical protein
MKACFAVTGHSSPYHKPLRVRFSSIKSFDFRVFLVATDVLDPTLTVAVSHKKPGLIGGDHFFVLLVIQCLV